MAAWLQRRALLVAALLTPIPGGSEALLTLRPGEALEQSFGSEVSRSYALPLSVGDLARISLRQQGADVAAILTAPDGGILTEADTPLDRNAVEIVSVVADVAGVYKLEVRAKTGGGRARSYRIELDPLRPATPGDRLRVQAERALAAADLGFQPSSPDLPAALDRYQQALGLWRDLGDRTKEGTTLYRIGLVHSRAGRVPEALEAFEEALLRQRETEDSRGIALTLLQRGRIRRLYGNLTGAAEDYREAVTLGQGLGESEIEAISLTNLGRLHFDAGDFQAALGAYEEALVLYRSQGETGGEAVVLNNIGGVLRDTGSRLEALGRFEQALALAREAELPHVEADTLNNLGDSYRNLGQLHLALERFAEAFEINDRLGYAPRRGTLLLNLGAVLAELGDLEEGRNLLLQALPLLQDPRHQALGHLSLGRIARSLGDLEEALQSFEQSLALQRRMQDRAGEAMSLRSLGFVHLAAGRAEEAREQFQEALALTAALGARTGTAEALRGLGSSWAALGNLTASQSSWTQGLEAATALGDLAEQARILTEIARSQRVVGNLGTARIRLEEALARLETLRSGIAGDDLRASHFAAQREVYEMYVDTLVELASGAAAFEAAEQARARGLLDFLGQAGVDLREGDPRLLADERRLRQEMNAKAALRTERLGKPDKVAEAAALDAELDALAAEHQIVEARLQAGSPRDAQLRRPEVRLAEIQREALDDGTVLLEYSLGEPRSHLWLVTPGSIASFELPGRERIEALARRVHERLGNPNPQEAAQEREDLAELSRLLLGPVVDRLDGKRLAVVADGALLYVPFAALPVPSRQEGTAVPLIVEHEVVHLPSAAVLRGIRRTREGRPRPGASLAVVADPVFRKDDPRLETSGTAVASAASPAQPSPPPPTGSWTALLGATRQAAGLARLPWTRREAEVIAAEATGRDMLLALDFAASRDLATTGLGRYRMIHFATHGLLDTRRPALSGLALSQLDAQGNPRDGYLRLHDIYHLRLNADLVVLSGCETALGRTLRGEGIIGLTRGFFHAGASQVMASLWPVRDRATSELMQRFYRAMLRDGLPASTALRQAQVSMWRERQWRDPYFWAAFILQGDWRAL